MIPGDVITALNGKKVDSVARLLAFLDDYKPGNIIKLTVWREGKEIVLPVTLQSGETGNLIRRRACCIWSLVW